MIRWSEFAFLCFLNLIFIIKFEVLDAFEGTTVDFNDEALSAIITKLIDIEQKVDAMQNKLKDMEKSETINIDKLIAQSVKEYEMERSLERMSQKIDDMNIAQREMKADIGILNRNLEEQNQRENPAIQSTISAMNITQIEKLIATIESASLGKNIIPIGKAVNDLRDSQQKFHSNLERYILRENQKLIENFEKKSDRIIRIIEIARKDIPIGYNRTHFPELESNFKNINKTFLENCKILMEKQYQNYEAAFGSLSIINNLSVPQEHLKVYSNNIKTQVVGYNASIAPRVNFLKEDIFESCSNALQFSATGGVYKLFIPESGFGPFEAECQLFGGTKWTIIQRRINGLVDFHRDWQSYKHGFGNPHGEYWIGLEKIHALTSKKAHMLRIQLGDFEGNRRVARYSEFEIGNEKEGYYLKKVGNYSGDAGDSLGKANLRRKFSTYDVDNDNVSSVNCAAHSSGAWWYDTCNWSDLNGRYNSTKNGLGINWSKWRGYNYSLKDAVMAIRELCEVGKPEHAENGYYCRVEKSNSMRKDIFAR